MSSDQLQLRVNQLETQLEEKDAELSDLRDEMDDVKKKDSSYSSSRSTSSDNYSSSSSSKEGIIRVDVAPEKVQQSLKNAGYYSGNVDGKIGEKTKKAIADFQKAHNLSPDGIIGKRTWNELKAYLE